LRSIWNLRSAHVYQHHLPIHSQHGHDAVFVTSTNAMKSRSRGSTPPQEVQGYPRGPTLILPTPRSTEKIQHRPFQQHQHQPHQANFPTLNIQSHHIPTEEQLHQKTFTSLTRSQHSTQQVLRTTQNHSNSMRLFPTQACTHDRTKRDGNSIPHRADARGTSTVNTHLHQPR